jgi:hypothetical protein
MSVQYVSGSLTLFPSRIALTTVSVVPAHLCCPVNWEIVGEFKADVARYDKFSAKAINPSHTSVNEIIRGLFFFNLRWAIKKDKLT